MRAVDRDQRLDQSIRVRGRARMRSKMETESFNYFYFYRDSIEPV